jgi:hypothetical protein
MEYIHTKTIKSNSATIRVFSPVLTDDERAKRMKAIHNAAAALLKETIRKEQK